MREEWVPGPFKHQNRQEALQKQPLECPKSTSSGSKRLHLGLDIRALPVLRQGLGATRVLVRCIRSVTGALVMLG